MEEGMRSADSSGVLVKNRNSSGCLIIRKKGDGVGAVGSSASRKAFESKKDKKRPRLVVSDSGSSDELLEPYRRRVASRTSQARDCFEKGIVEGSEIRSRRSQLEHIKHRNGEDEMERKRSRLDVFEFDEYDGLDGISLRKGYIHDREAEIGGRSIFGLKGGQKEFETGSSGRDIVYRRKHSYFDTSNSLVSERSKGTDYSEKNRFKLKGDGRRIPVPLMREEFGDPSEEPIRLQGKNGVLKVMIKKKKGSGLLKTYDHLEAEENRKALRSGDTVKRNELIHQEVEENRKSLRSRDTVKRNELIHPSFYSDKKVHEKAGSFVRAEKNQLNSRKSFPTKSSKAPDWETEDSDTSLKVGSKNVEVRKSMKMVKDEEERNLSSEKLSPARCSEGKVRRGTGTEKQKLREQIRGMLLDAGWTIDYRPRRNRDYQDAVYVNPSGTAYWSIIKAYDALQKQFEEEDNDLKPSREPISEEVLSKLTRQTRKKIEKEMNKKRRDYGGSKSAQDAATKRTKRATESMVSDRAEEKLSSFIKQGGKSLRGRINENGFAGQNSTHLSHDVDHVNGENLSDNLSVQGRKSRKLGRCTLLVRSSDKGLHSEADGYVPYTGKRTLLSWLIDSGTVELSGKVQYMNRRRTKVMLEGWITRDGIHCGCCSKILTVSKFEIHAGSKLRQPFQNIYVDSGASLLQCQIDAWNRQEESECSSFHSIDVDGDDPNDDTCGICGDGGDLICCDGCPSTFHQSCLDIQMLPPGDWHCPNCTCKFCGMAGGSIAQETCSLCEKKYHQSCIQEVDALPVNSTSPCPTFCGKKCRELFEHLQMFLGVKHELEAGFSWSLVRRTDTSRGLPQRVECNSKLAVALTVMDECFLPIVDRRSGVNLIHNVLYNRGSNFNRLNYSGFYTAILERGDEIISAASIRFHGTQLAEMPFIGTRHIYRRQGMCRRLFCAIESALCSFKVEKLIIPAISELMHTWTEVFDFNSLEESHKKEMRSMNMLVFPGIDMLQKLLVEQDNTERNVTVSTGAKPMELEGKRCSTPEMSNKSDNDSCTGHELHVCDDAGVHHVSDINDKVVASNSGSQAPGVSLNDTSVLSGSSDAPHEVKFPVTGEGILGSNSQSGDEVPGSATEAKCLSHADTRHVTLEMENEPVLDSPMEGNIQFPAEGGMDAANVNKVVCVEPVLHSLGEMYAQNDTKEVNEIENAISVYTHHGTDEGIMQLNLDSNHHNASERESKSSVASEVVSDETQSEEAIVLVSGEYSGTDACEVKIGSRSGDNLAESATESKCLFPSDMSDTFLKMESKPVLSLPVGGNIHSSAEGDIDGVNVNNNAASVESVLHSLGEISAHNSTEDVNGNKNALSVSTFHGTEESVMQFNSDLNQHSARERESKSFVASAIASDAMHCEATIIFASGDCSGADACEVKTKSAFV
ncbi:hypothetical protein L1049_016592 [Liquidambar formosana]|uniref:PHD-type domain-containing protein n=1 Tax=Liquidambar formosana TaxID=63359 RepID=A0AAP0X0P7_LIQFO